jgi:hypothetical protein
MKVTREYKIYDRKSAEFQAQYIETLKSDILFFLLNDFNNKFASTKLTTEELFFEFDNYLNTHIIISEEALEILANEKNE